MKSERAGEPMGFGMFVLRLWMWAVPVLIVVAAAAFGVVAAIDGRWGLVALMLVMGLVGAGLFTLHWWVMRRMGAK